MRKIICLFILMVCFQANSQIRYIDDEFEISEKITKTYATKDGEELKLDIYQPKNDSVKERPAIIFMHGGGFSVGSRENPEEIKFAKMAAAKGYVAVLISYRLTRKGKLFDCDYEAAGKIETFKLAAEDFLDAASFIKDHSAEYKIDPEKIIVGGSSAGAEAVLHAVYNRNVIFPASTKYNNVKFAGVFSLAGAITDARYITETNVVPGVFFHGTGDELVPYGTAAHHFCDPNEPGYLMLDGSRTITQKLKDLNTSYALFTFTGAGHEISGMPFDYMTEVFQFFSAVFLKGEKIQSEIVH